MDEVTDIKDARVLAKLGDSVTTDHISPAGSIAVDGPAGQYLIEKGVIRILAVFLNDESSTSNYDTTSYGGQGRPPFHMCRGACPLNVTLALAAQPLRGLFWWRGPRPTGYTVAVR